MTLQDLLNIIVKIPTEDIKLYLVTRKVKEGVSKRSLIKDKYLFHVYQIDSNDDIRSSLFDSTTKQLTKIIDKNFEMIDYEILSDESENLFTYPIRNKIFSFSDVVTNQLYSLTPKVNSLSEITSNEEEMWAYCVEFYDAAMNKKIFTFRKVLPSKVCIDEKGKNFLRAAFSTQSKKLTLLREETINLDCQIDCIYYEEIFYVVKKACFEQIVGLQEEFKEKAIEIATKMIDSGNFVGAEILHELIEKKPSIHKKLLKVEKIGSYGTLDKKAILKMSKVCKKYNDVLPIKDGKLSIENEVDIDVVLKALADYYKVGEISGKPYGTFSGRELSTTKK